MIFQETIQRKLSEKLGVEVSFDKVNLSLLDGSVEAIGVRVGDVLTVARIIAKVTLGRVLKGEINVKSLTIEKPVVNIDLSAGFGPKGSPKTQAPADDSPGDQENHWGFLDIEKILVVDGQVQLSGRNGYRASVEKLLLELNRNGNSYGLTLLADSVGRRDRSVELGELRGTATIGNISDLTQVLRASAEGNIELGKSMKLKLRTPQIQGGAIDVSFDGKIDLQLIKSVLP